MAVAIIPDNYFSPLFGNCSERRLCGPSTFNANGCPVRFNRCLNSDMTDLLTTMMCDIMETPRKHQRRNKSKNVEKVEKKDQENNFEVKLEVRDFTPDEIQVKTVDDKILMIEAKHEENTEENGFICRQFSRKYVLPEKVQLEKIHTSLSAEGVLTITAPKLMAIEEHKPEEKSVPITMESNEPQQESKEEYESFSKRRTFEEPFYLLERTLNINDLFNREEPSNANVVLLIYMTLLILCG
ncbi:Heat shock protein beta-1 [Nymphon striatum]|nr:Heat shock protein beta-1 [Nymphon striatum]